MSPDTEASDRPLVIVGSGVVTESCAAAWKDAQPQRRIEMLSVDAPDGFNRDLAALSDYPRDIWMAFGVLPGAGVNMARLKLMMDLKMLGYKLDSFVSPRAMVPTGWSPPENAFVSDGAVIAHMVTAKYNLFVGPRSVIGYGSKLGHSVWIGTGSIIGANVTIGDNSLIGQAAVLADGVAVGRHCELMIAREYNASIDDKTFFSPMFEKPVRIYGSRPR